MFFCSFQYSVRGSPESLCVLLWTPSAPGVVVVVETFQWKAKCRCAGGATGRSKVTTKVNGIHPLGTMNVCDKCDYSPLNDCWDMSLGWRLDWHCHAWSWKYDLDRCCQRAKIALKVPLKVTWKSVLCKSLAVERFWRGNWPSPLIRQS